MQLSAFPPLPVYGRRRSILNIIRVMKLTCFFCFALCLGISAKTLSQGVSLDVKSASLKTIFREITRQTGVSLIYNEDILKHTAPVTISVKNVPVKDALEICLKGQGLDFEVTAIGFKIKQNKTPGPDGNTIGTSITDSVPGSQKVKGRVVDARTGNPLEGATITLKRTGKGAISDIKGSFSLNDIRQGDVVSASFIGYSRKSIRIEKTRDLVFTLSAADDQLDKLEIQGYGTTSKRLATGSIVTVTAQQIESQPVLNPVLALRGQVPGLIITPTSGYASSPVKLQVRGDNNINPLVSSDPLIVIDGMPVTNINMDGSNQKNGQSILPVVTTFNIGATPTGGQSPLFGINPMDIESITVLKDADATAIYGSRGANGVILVTTKKGKGGNVAINLNARQGLSKDVRRYQLLDISQYVKLRKEALQNDGLGLNTANAADLLTWDTTQNVNWQKTLWNGTGKVTSLNLDISGGNEFTSFRIGGGYNKQAEILTVSGGNQAGNLNFNINSQSKDRKFSVGLQGMYNYTYTNEVNQAGLATTLAPDAPPMYDSTGTLNYAAWTAAGLGSSFPYGGLLLRSKTSSNSLNSNLLLKYKILTGLDISTSFGYNLSLTGNTNIDPIAANNPYNGITTGTATFTSVNNGGWTIEPQINYSRFIGPGKLSVMLGGTLQNSYSKYTINYGTGYTNDALINSIVNAGVQQDYDNYGIYKYVGVYARLNYDLYNKYIFNFNARRDGSSRFGESNIFGDFGSAAGAWILSEEKWMKKILPSFFGFLKLRGSYGSTGGDGVPDYAYLSQWSSVSGTSLVPGYDGVSRPLLSVNPGNQRFRWQTNKKLDEAIEISLFKDNSLTFLVEHYRNRSSNQLLQYPIPSFTGIGGVTANWPATVQNTGWEFSLSESKIIHTKDFNWSGNFNISFNRNVLLKYPGFASSPYATQYVVGKALNTVYLYHVTGVDPMTGLYVYKDYNHNGILENNQSYGVPPMTSTTDNRIAMNLNPTYTGGVTQQLNYKKLSLTLLFDFRKQMGLNAFASNGLVGNINHNIPLELYNDMWHKPGDKASYAKASAGNAQSINNLSVFASSDRIYTDASFIRLASLSFSYTLPAQNLKRAGIQSASIFINAQNLFFITGYKGTDPETQSFSGMPQPRVVMGGLSVNL